MKQFSWGAIFRGAIFLGGIFPEGIFPGAIFLGGLFPGVNFPGQFSRGHFSGRLFSWGHFSGHQILLFILCSFAKKITKTLENSYQLKKKQPSSVCFLIFLSPRKLEIEGTLSAIYFIRILRYDCCFLTLI